MPGESYRVDRSKRSEREEVSARFCLEQVVSALFSSSRLKQIELWKSWSCKEASGGVDGTDLKFSPLCVSFQELVESTMTQIYVGEGYAGNQANATWSLRKEGVLEAMPKLLALCSEEAVTIRRCRSVIIRARIGKIPSALKEPLLQGTRTLYASL
jgi:hypothetical protein